MIAIGCKQHNEVYKNAEILNNLQNSTNPSQKKIEQKINLQQGQDPKQINHFYIYAIIKQQGSDDAEKWCQLNLQSFNVSENVNDISWCHQNGRNFHTIALCGVFGLQIITFQYNGGVSVENIQTIYNSKDHNIEYYRLTWNVLGTILAASDSQNEITLYNCT